jgi:toxin ParE1/3/4
VTYRLSLDAVQDLESIQQYVLEKRPSSVDDVMESIEAACILLGLHPGVGRTRDEIAAGVLSFPAGRYLIFYDKDNDTINILRVIHGSRDIPIAFFDR